MWTIFFFFCFKEKKVSRQINAFISYYYVSIYFIPLFPLFLQWMLCGWVQKCFCSRFHPQQSQISKDSTNLETIQINHSFFFTDTDTQWHLRFHFLYAFIYFQIIVDYFSKCFSFLILIFKKHLYWCWNFFLFIF